MNMDAEQYYEIWAPDGAVWSDWAKPVLFATMPKLQVDPNFADLVMDVSWASSIPAGHALVVDLEGVASVCCGYYLASQGFRPVPLYNAAYGPKAVIAVDLIGAALQALAEPLQQLNLAADARPAFLLDSARMGSRTAPEPGEFDNRWFAFPQDFPSAIFLQAHGIVGVVLVTNGALPAEDLAHVLLRWQKAGLPISIMNPRLSQEPRLIEVRRPVGFRNWFRRLLVLMGLRRSSAGGFGGLVPSPSSGGGFG